MEFEDLMFLLQMEEIEKHEKLQADKKKKAYDQRYAGKEEAKEEDKKNPRR